MTHEHNDPIPTDSDMPVKVKEETAADLFARARAIAGDSFKGWKRPPRGNAEPVEPLEINDAESHAMRRQHEESGLAR
jgi:hypothetical protein